MESLQNPNATAEQIEEDLIFVEILIESLDEGSGGYEHQLAEHTRTKEALEQRLEQIMGSSRPQSQMGMDGSNDQQGFGYQPIFNGQDGSRGFQYGNGHSLIPAGPSLTPPNGVKRPRPQSSALAANDYPYKRATPEPSSAGTPTSSTDSFELVEHPTQSQHPSLSERARQRQLAAEAALKRRREDQQKDEEFARRLSQPQSSRPSVGPSSSRPGIQTTLGHGGSFQRPPPPVKGETPKMQPPLSYSVPGFSNAHSRPSSTTPARQTPAIKPEPGLPKQQLVQRPRQNAAVVDLTSDSDEEDLSEIAPNNFTPNKRAPKPQPQPQINGYQAPMPSMPGAYPLNIPTNGGYVYNQPQSQAPSAYDQIAQNNDWLKRTQEMGRAAVHGVRSAVRDFTDDFANLNNLINGSSSRPVELDEDDSDVEYSGYRPVQPNPFDPYAGREDLYRSRYDMIADNNPQKTKEEINNLLGNIRPDEDLPEDLLVRTPEAMTIKLHKYQELGLTWLKKCEEGSNMGGILADDMGLGKTIQMLSLMVTRKSEDPRCRTTLIVAPVALLRQWKQEIQQKIKPGRHALTVYTHHGATKKKDHRELQIYDVVLTTFGSLAAEVKKQEAFRLRQHADPDARPYPREKCVLIGQDIRWYRVILDEAQCIKNKSTQTAKGACMLNAKYRFCMTGTPMMNNVDELYSLIHFLRIKPYDQWEKFRNAFSQPLKSPHEESRGRAMRTLQVLCKAIMLRRTKKSTFEGKPILILPERTTEVENPEFDEDETTFYKALETQTQLTFNKYLRRGTVGSQYSAILVLLLRLRQACCHPHLIKDYGVSASADLTGEELVELAKQLLPQVVARIKETGGNFECPVCMDAVTNPAIFIPCGHDTCSDCFARIADPAQSLAEGNENGGKARCPHCRGDVDPKKITDFQSFKKVHMPELLTAQEQQDLEQPDDEDDEDSETESEDDETESEDEKGNLKDFVVDDDDEDDEETESEAGDVKDEHDDDSEAGPSSAPKKLTKKQRQAAGLAKGKKPAKAKAKAKKSEKAKGKQKKEKGKVTLADLKKSASRNAAARKKYLRRLRKDFVSSAKIEKTMAILRDITSDPEGEKVLIFSQWTSLLDLLEIPIDQEGFGYRRYDGSMNAKMRADAVDDFKDPRKNVRIMLVSLKAGNAGLNLNVASQVIILDPFWNPYIEEQAIDRAHRIGQEREVKVHRVLIQNTVEDRIIELQEKKRALISEALDEQQAANISRLGVQELAYLFGVTHNPNEQIAYQPRDSRR